MNCPRCHEPVEPGAAFCGNCGQPLQQAQVPQPPTPTTTVAAPVPVPPVSGQAAAAPMTIPADGVLTPAAANNPASAPAPSPAAPVAPAAPTASSPAPVPMPGTPPAPMGSGGFPPPPNGIPGYARANPDEHKAETKAMIALIVGVLSLGGLFITYIGIVLGVIAAVLAGGARPELRKKTVATLAMVFAVIGFLLGSIGLGYNIYRYSKDGDASAGYKTGDSSNQSALDDTTGSSAATKTTEGKVADTPCFKATLPNIKTVDASTDSCMVTAYDGVDATDAKRAVIIDSTTRSTLTADKLPSSGKALADEYANKGMTITSQKSGTFAGSPAYFINAMTKDSISMSVVTVLKKTSHGENLFVVVETVDGKGADVSQYDKSWQWK